MDKADLPLRRQHLAGRRRPEISSTRVADPDSKQALAAPELNAGALDAGQVGIPMVRRLGLGLSHRSVRADRSRVRERTALSDAVRTVSASEWSGTCL